MKNFSFLKYIIVTVGFVFTLQSCSNEDESEFSELVTTDLTWLETTDITITAEADKEAFVWEKNVLTLDQYWKNQEVVLNGKISSTLNVSQFTKIDFFITAEELNGYNYTAPFDTTGQLLNSVTNISSEGEFSLQLDGEEVYQLFASKFQNDRSEAKVYDGDLFEIHWVITNSDGSELDSREFSGGKYRYSILGKTQELAPPLWQDTYNFEWLSGDDIFAAIGAPIDATGQITITESAVSGIYDVPNMLFNVDFGFPFTGIVDFNFDSGLSLVNDNVFGLISWHFSNVNGSSIDVEIIGMEALLPIPDIIYKVRLTRTDGANWPTNIHH